MAYDIDGIRVVMLPPSVSEISNNGPVHIRTDYVECTSATLPFTISGTSIDIRAHIPPYGLHNVAEGFDASFEMMIIRRLYCYVDKGFRLEPDNASYKEKNSFCIGEPEPTPIADDARNADESASLSTQADH